MFKPANNRLGLTALCAGFGSAATTVLLLLQLYGATVMSIDKDAKQVVLADGGVIQYDSLVSTMPLDVTLGQLGKRDWADGMQHSSTHIIGIGVRGHW